MRRNLFCLVIVTPLFLLSIIDTGIGVHHSSEAITSTRLLVADTAIERGSEERVGVDEKELSAKLATWILEKKHPQEVLNLLQLVPKYSDVKDVLNHPKFKSWLRYVKEFCDQNPSTELSPRSLLIEQYNEDKVTAAIDSLNPSRRQLYNELQPGWRYGRDSNQSPQSFHPIQTLNHHDFIQYWIDYTNRFNALKQSDKDTSITSLLRANFYDRDILIKVVTAPTTTDNKVTARNIQTIIFKDWINLRKTPYEALIELDLNNPNQVPFSNPLYSLWVEYVELFNNEWTRFKMTDVEAFLRWYKPIELAKLLSSVIHSHSSKETIVKQVTRPFQDKVVNYWLSRDISPEDLYKELELDEKADIDGLFLWCSYLNSRVIQGGDVDVLARIVEMFPKDVFKMLRIATGYDAIRNTAKKLMISCGESVLRDKVISPADAFENFQLNKLGSKLLSHPLFKKWLEYSETIHQEHPGPDSSWLTILTASYDDIKICDMIGKANANARNKKIANEVTDALIKLRLESMAPHVFFLNLGIHKFKKPGQFLTSPAFYVWNKYYIEFNKQHREKDIKMIKFIQSNFGLRTAMGFHKE